VYLQKLIKCLTTKLYSAPKLDVKHLRAVLKSLVASASAAEGERVSESMAGRVIVGTDGAVDIAVEV